MDSFEELPVDQWAHLREKLKTGWPLNVGGYYALDMNIKHTQVREAFQFKVYCPYGDMNNGFITTSVKKFGTDFHTKNVKKLVEVGTLIVQKYLLSPYYAHGRVKSADEEYMIFPIGEDTSKLEEALEMTTIIDWNSNMCIGMASSMVIRLMERVKTKMELDIFNVWGAKVLYLDKSAKLFDDVMCPPDTFLAAVDQDHIKQVDEAWPFRHRASHFYFSTLVSNGLSYGLYSLDKKLLAWIFVNEYNSLCHLYCEASHRRKGYADFLLKTVVNDRLKQGSDVYGYVVPGNVKAMELFLKHGFQFVDDGAWINAGRKNDSN